MFFPEDVRFFQKTRTSFTQNTIDKNYDFKILQEAVYTIYVSI